VETVLKCKTYLPTRSAYACTRTRSAKVREQVTCVLCHTQLCASVSNRSVVP